MCKTVDLFVIGNMADLSSGAQSAADTEPVEDGVQDEIPVVRVRKCTEKAQEEMIRRLEAGLMARLQ